MFAPKYEDEEDTTFEHVKQGTVNLFRDAKNGMFDAFQDAFDLNPDIPLTASSAALSDPDDQYEDEDDDDLY
jgi:hypothetical protein